MCVGKTDVELERCGDPEGSPRRSLLQPLDLDRLRMPTVNMSPCFMSINPHPRRRAGLRGGVAGADASKDMRGGTAATSVVDISNRRLGVGGGS